MRRALLALALIGVPQLASAALNGAPGSAGPSTLAPIALPLTGEWYYAAASTATIGPDGLGGWMYVPAQTDLYQVSSAGPVVLSITDAFVTGDQFEVYVDGALVLATPAVPAGAGPEIQPSVPGSALPYPDQATVDAAFASPLYSHGSVVLLGGDHLVNVKDVAFPLGFPGAGFALRATAATPVRPRTWGALKNLYK